MITHKFAIVCAEVLQQYCEENYFADKEVHCPNCIFAYPGFRSCYLKMFVGIDGKEMQDMAKKKVEERLRELREKQHGTEEKGN